MKKRSCLRYIILILFFSILLMANVILYFTYDNLNLIRVPHDVDRKANGNTLIASVSFSEMLHHIKREKDQIPMEHNNPQHEIIEVNTKGDIVWRFYGLACPHEVLELPNGHLLVADTQFDRVIEIDYPNKNIIWSWEPAKINWTKVNPKWGADHYYNNPRTYDWTHLNDVDFKQYGSWNACLISIRNFDLIVEINYTADFIDPNNPKNVVWWYGDFENHSMLFRQHNPDYLKNGNIIIADSGNDRIIEVNYTTKEIIWKLDKGLKWPRDADELPNGNILITDSSNSRVIEYNKNANKVVWSYSQDLIIPYESDLLNNTHVLISSAYNGFVLEVNRAGVVIWRWGYSYVKAVLYLNCIWTLIISLMSLFFMIKKLNFNKKRSQQITYKSYIIIGMLIFFIVASIILLIFYSQIFAFIAKSFYTSLGPEAF